MGLVWILNGQKEVGLQMVRISNGIENPGAQPFCRKPFELRPKRKKSGFLMSVFLMVETLAMAMAKALPFEFGPSKSLDFKRLRILNGWFSDSTVLSHRTRL